MEETEMYESYWQPRFKAIEQSIRISERLDKAAIAKRIRRGLRNLRNQMRGAYVVDKTPIMEGAPLES